MGRFLPSVVPLAFLSVLAQPVLAQEKVAFASTDGDLRSGAPTMLTGFLYKPEGSGPFPALVTMHGCDGLVGDDGKVKVLYGVWGDVLSHKGYIVLAPDSYGSRGYNQSLCAKPPNERPVKSDREVPRDVYGALGYLRSRPDVRANSIAILGQSAGASAMFNTITEDARPKDLLPQEDFRAAVALYPGCQSFIAREPRWAPRLPLLLLMGEADNWTPAADCKELISRVPASAGVSIETKYYPGAFHAFDHPDLPMRINTNVKLPPDGHSPSVGSNPEARSDAIIQVNQFLAGKLK